MKNFPVRKLIRPLYGLALLAALLLPSASLASGIKLTPFVGARFGGDIQSSDVFDDAIEDGKSYGLTADFPIRGA